MNRRDFLKKFILILREVSYRGTLLFTHPDGEFRRRALAVASTILACESKAHEIPCGICPVCTTSVNPDVIEYAASRFTGGVDSTGLHPEHGSKGGGREPSRGVELLRTMLARFRETPVVMGRRVLILHDIPSLSREALNTMLVELEEPPGKNIVLLSAADPFLVLPTIRSRALHLPIPDSFPNYPIPSHVSPSFPTTQSHTPDDPLMTRIDGKLSPNEKLDISIYRNIEQAAELLRLRRLYMSRRLSPELVRAFLAHQQVSPLFTSSSSQKI